MKKVASVIVSVRPNGHYDCMVYHTDTHGLNHKEKTDLLSVADALAFVAEVDRELCAVASATLGRGSQ